ncbi:hypothetical protein [Nocardia inohanensis]|uniref:hypothetical protein n=1 Tax=Nocardia inohanensis TaxID=209246 RepID=UPI000A61F806|nr:hypothetical protein [Nocardia inohanensis]
MTTKYETPGLGASAMLMALRLPTGLRHAVGELRYTGRRSGRNIALPVSVVRTEESVIIRVGEAEAKNWWRNFRAPHPASIRVDGRWLSGTGHVVAPGTLEHEQIEAVYQGAHPRAQLSATDPYVVIAVRPDAKPAAAQSLRRRWLRRVTLGEFLGFCAPAVAGTLVADAGAGITVAAMLLAGMIEGGVLGAFQAGVLRTALPRLRARDWIAATIAGAVLAWSIGLVPMLYGERFGAWPVWVQVPAVAAGALIMVFSIGTAQWMILRRFVDGATLWIWGTAVAWIAGLTAFMLVTMPLWQPGQPAALVAAIGLLGGLVMAAVMAAVTGAFLARTVTPAHLLPADRSDLRP